MTNSDRIYATNIDKSIGDEITDEKNLLLERLRETGRECDRFTRPVPQKKNPAYSGWNDLNKAFSPEEVSHHAGILAGRGILLVDIDSYEAELPEDIDAFLNEYPTFVWRSPHGGLSLIYVVPEDTPERFETAFGKENICFEWGEVQTNKVHSLIPGAEIDHKHCSDSKRQTGACPGQGVGSYDIVYNREIPKLPIERFIATLEPHRQTRKADEPSLNQSEVSVIERSPEEWELRCFEHARSVNKELDGLCKWAEGDEDFDPNGLMYFSETSRSHNEVHLAEQLYKQLGWIELDADYRDADDVVGAIICHLMPPRYKEERSVSYLNSVLEYGRLYSLIDEGPEHYYIPPTPEDKNEDSPAPVLRCKAESVAVFRRLKSPA